MKYYLENKEDKMLLSERQEEKRGNDWYKYQIPNDKIRVNEEPYESFYMVNNKEDAVLFKKVFNQLAMKHLGVTFPIVYRRYVQGRVFYDIFHHRWCVRKDGKLLQIGYEWKASDKEWERFRREVNEKLGEVYILKD